MNECIFLGGAGVLSLEKILYDLFSEISDTLKPVQSLFLISDPSDSELVLTALNGDFAPGCFRRYLKL